MCMNSLVTGAQRENAAKIDTCAAPTCRCELAGVLQFAAPLWRPHIAKVRQCGDKRGTDQAFTL